MRIAPITVAIPVGPHPSNQEWLAECLQSIFVQTMLPAEILIIDDGAKLAIDRADIRVWRTPWRSGVAHAFNFGVALAAYDLVIMLGSDDKLLPKCVEYCWAAWETLPDPHAYWALPIQYEDGRVQWSACNAAMVHKELWRLTGGFPVEASVGMCDTFLIHLIEQGGGRFGSLRSAAPEPLYWYRQHAQTDTERRRSLWHGIAITARNTYLLETLA